MISSTISTYDKYHQVYDLETVDFWQNFPRKTINEFTTRLKGKKILNIGSGPGRDALLLRDHGLDVTCLDASLEMVKRTQKLGFDSIQADMRKLDFPGKSFDGVWAYTSLLHIKTSEVEKVLEKIHTILKSDGILLIGMIEGNFQGEVERGSMPGTKRYFRFYSEKELKSIIEKRGFKFEFQEKYTPHSRTYLNQIYSVLS